VQTSQLCGCVAGAGSSDGGVRESVVLARRLQLHFAGVAGGIDTGCDPLFSCCTGVVR
jgi:hypothetical protein